MSSLPKTEYTMLMVQHGLQELLYLFDLRVEQVYIDFHFETHRYRASAKIVAESTFIFVHTDIGADYDIIERGVHKSVTDSIYRLFTQAVPEMDIKEAVADELLPPSVLEHIERSKSDTASMRG